MIDTCEQNPVHPRVREITDALGSRLRVSVETRLRAIQGSGILVSIERPDQRGRPQAMFDGRGAEIVSEYIMALRLISPDALPDERIEGCFPARLRLRRTPCIALIITQPHLERPFEIPAPFWDRLYAELAPILAYAREPGGRMGACIR